MPPAAPPAFILGNKPGTVSLRVSGTNRVLRTWIDKKKNVWAQMPVPSRIRIRSIKQFQIVELDGITQVVTPLLRGDNTPNELKQRGLEILKLLNLTDSSLAAGVMFVSRKRQNLKIDPVVWVRDIKTLFYETACASGTTAVAVAEFLAQPRKIAEFSIIQPSGKRLLAKAKKFSQEISVAIGGKVKILEKNAAISFFRRTP